MVARRELIEDDVVTTLETISIANGDNFDYPGGVQRFEITGLVTRDPPFISAYIAEETKVLTNLRFYDCTLVFAIDIWVLHPASEADSTGELLSRHVADAEKALMVDGTRGGIAIESFLTGWKRELPLDSDEYVVAALKMNVDYRHKFDDPEAAA